MSRMEQFVMSRTRSKLSNPLSLDHQRPDLFVTSMTFSTETYLVWTCLWALWHTVWLCLDPLFLWQQGLLPDKEWIFQLTHVGYIVLTMHAILDFVTVYKYWKQGETNRSEMTICIKVSWLFYTLLSGTAVPITALYFFLHQVVFQVNSLNFHIVNSIYTLQTLIVSNKPLNCVHVLYPMCFASLYVLVTSVHQVTTGTVLYEAFDWTNFSSTMLMALGCVFIVVPSMYFFMFTLTYIRRKVTCQRDYRPETEENQPLNQTV